MKFFFTLSLQKEYIASAPKDEPPIPIRMIDLYLLNFLSSEYLKLNLNLLLNE